jgi:thioredoxin 1
MDVTRISIRCALAGALLLSAPSFAAPVPPAGSGFQMTATKIFSDTADAKQEIQEAILKANAEHKHVLLDFGGNWCADCQLLNIYFHDPGNASLLAANYVVVEVNIGEYDKNLDIAQKYGIPLKLGVPAMAVLDGKGRLLYAQRNGEFEKMRKLDSSAVNAFLEKWKPQRAAQKRKA